MSENKLLQQVNEAKQALQSGDFKSAIKNIGSALWSDPTNKEWLSLAKDILQKSGDLVKVTPSI